MNEIENNKTLKIRKEWLIKKIIIKIYLVI